MYLGQKSLAEPIPLQAVDHSRKKKNQKKKKKRLGPGYVDSDPLGSCIPDGDFIEEIHVPILRCHVSTLAFGFPQPTCKAAGDCGGWGCPVPVQNGNSAHCPPRRIQEKEKKRKKKKTWENAARFAYDVYEGF